jgi:hypothetical protein
MSWIFGYKKTFSMSGEINHKKVVVGIFLACPSKKLFFSE